MKCIKDTCHNEASAMIPLEQSEGNYLYYAICKRHFHMMFTVTEIPTFHFPEKKRGGVPHGK